jgi:hypothetical protein
MHPTKRRATAHPEHTMPRCRGQFQLRDNKAYTLGIQRRLVAAFSARMRQRGAAQLARGRRQFCPAALRWIGWVLLLPACAGQSVTATDPPFASEPPYSGAAPRLSSNTATPVLAAHVPVPSSTPRAATTTERPLATRAAPGASDGSEGVRATNARDPHSPSPLCVVVVDGLSVLRECSGAPGESPQPPVGEPVGDPRRKCLVSQDSLEILRPCQGTANERPARQ